MPYTVPLLQAKAAYPEYYFITPLTPSEQKAAFHVRDRSGVDLCLKIIAPNYDIDRFHREITALQAISHPNVVAFREYTFSSTPHSQRHHIIEEFVEGTDLTSVLISNQPWSRAKVADFFIPLCEGLAALRTANVVHRDLKPSNIRVRRDGSPVIIDFGLARHLYLPDLTRTSEGAAIGTPRYFAPEQFEGTKYDIDHRTDLFAVGILMYEALVGQHPFHAPNMTMAQLRDAVCSSEACFNVPGFTSLPSKWQLLQRRLLEKDRARRPSESSLVATLLHRLREV
jgi:eukaryotic-like serine/threonine-protein kinase